MRVRRELVEEKQRLNAVSLNSLGRIRHDTVLDKAKKKDILIYESSK